MKIFKYLGSLFANENHSHEEIKFRLKAGNSSSFSVQTILPSGLLSKNLKIKVYKTIILPCRDISCETWFLTLRVFENRTLRQIFGPKSDENGGWSRFHNDELYSLYHSSNIAKGINPRRLRWADHLARMEAVNAFNILTGTPIRKRPLGRQY